MFVYLSPQWGLSPRCPCVSLTIITYLSEENIVQQDSPAHGRPSIEKKVSQRVMTRTQHSPVLAKLRDVEALTGSGNRGHRALWGRAHSPFEAPAEGLS